MKRVKKLTHQYRKPIKESAQIADAVAEEVVPPYRLAKKAIGLAAAVGHVAKETKKAHSQRK